MKLTLKNMQQMNPSQIFDCLMPEVDSVYEQFRYLNLSKKDFAVLVNQEVLRSMHTYDGVKPYTDFIKENLTSSLETVTRERMTDSKTTSILLEKYVQQTFSSFTSEKDCVEKFEQLQQFFEKYSIEPTQKMILNLAKQNSVFQQMGDALYQAYQSSSSSLDFDKMLENKILAMVLDTYCTMQNNEVVIPDKDSVRDVPSSVVAYLREITQIPLLSLEEEKELASKVAQGDAAAKNKLIESNLRLVVRFAKNYLNQGLSYLDLIQEGNLGLMKAVEKYDVEKGCHFATYAVYWIKQAMSRATANKGRNIRIPVQVYLKVGTCRRTIRKLSEQLKRQPTIDEVANAMGMSVKEASELYNLQDDTISMNSIVSADSDTELGDFIPSSNDTPEEIALSSALKDDMQKLFTACNLKEMEQNVLMMRYGFYNQEPMTLEEIGNIYHVTRERIRQLEAKALMKLRRSRQVKEMADYTLYPEASLQNIEEFKEKYRIDGQEKPKTYLKTPKNK